MQSTEGILTKTISHQPYFMLMYTALKEGHPTKCIRVNVLNKEALWKVKNYIISSLIHNKLDTSPNVDPNHNYDIIITEINQSAKN